MDETPGLWLWRSPRLEDLMEVLRESLAEAPEDPVEPQRVIVGSRGMERWLSQQLASPRGVCANVKFSFLQRALQDGLNQVLGSPPAAPKDDPESLCWAVLSLLQQTELLEDLPEVKAYLEKEGGDARRESPVSRRTWAWARAMADILDRYGFFRPEWVRAQAAGKLPPELAQQLPEAWQLELWRRVSLRLHLQPLALRVDQGKDLLAQGKAGAVTGPLHIFGIASFAPLNLEIMDLLAQSTAVHVYALTPSHLYMGDLRARRGSGVSPEVLQTLLEEPPPNALLANGCRLYRDFQLLLEEKATRAQEPREDLGAPVAAPRTALEQLQQDVYEQTGPRPKEERLPVVPGDRSVQVHGCHGPTRQVEVLRDVVLGLLDTGTLEPRDILVMTTDIATYAPLVELVFRRGPAGREGNQDFGTTGAPSIPVEISDQSLTATNAVADVLLRVLALADERVTASAVLDLLALEPVRARVGLEEADLPRVRALVQDAGIRWGETAEERARQILGAQFTPDHPLASNDQNTWAFGLERLALAVTSTQDSGMFNKRLAGTGVEGDRVRVFGALVSFVRTLLAWRKELQQPVSVVDWRTRVRDLLEDLVDTEETPGWLLAQVHERFDDVVDGAERAGFLGLLTAGALQRALQGEFDNPRAGDRPLNGAVTLCSMTPMRSIPFKVVVLLGLADGEFPRRPKGLGVDAVARSPQRGDRSPRDEDRHEFLEALLCAREHFILVHAARNPGDNSELAVCAPVAELLETLDATFAHPEDRPARELFCLEHPLQPFSARNFRKTGTESPRSYDAAARALAAQLQGQRAVPGGIFGPGAEECLAAAERGDVRLDDLVAFFKNPAKELLKRRLAVNLEEHADELPDREPTALDTLETWKLAEDLLEEALKAAPQAAWQDATCQVLRAKGGLPLGKGAEDYLSKALEQATCVTDEVQKVAFRAPLAVDVAVGKHRLTGVIPKVTEDGVIYDLGAEDVDKPRRLLRAWIRALAAKAAHPDLPGTARLLGSKKNSSKQKTSADKQKEFVLVERSLSAPGDAAAVLNQLVELYWRGQERPLRCALKSSHAFARQMVKATVPWMEAMEELDKAVDEAEKEWEGHEGRGEKDDASVQAVFGGAPPWNPPPGTGGVVHPEFLEVAETLWRPILGSAGRDPAVHAEVAPPAPPQDGKESKAAKKPRTTKSKVKQTEGT